MQKILLDNVDKIIGKKISEAIMSHNNLVIHFDDDSFIVLEAGVNSSEEPRLSVSMDNGYDNYRPVDAYRLYEKGIIDAEKYKELMHSYMEEHQRQ